MARRVVCISRLVGAGGEDVGRLVAQSLGYRLVDEEILQRAAESSGASVAELADAERRTKVIEGLMRSLALGGGAAGLLSGGSAGSIEVLPPADPKSLRALIQKSIHETAERGDVVIVSHAASFALAGRDDVLRVLVTAPPQTRAGHAAHAGVADGRAASKLVADSDASRAAYLKRFYGVRQELPTHYDLALNSDSLSIEVMADLVARASSSS